MFRSLVHRLRQPLSRCYCTQMPEQTVARTEKCINQVILLGRSGSIPHRRGTDEHPVVIFSLATDITYRDNNDGIKSKTEWHRISIFKPYLRDQIYQYMKKGHRLFVKGRLSYGEVYNSEGTKYIANSIIADEVILLSHPSSSSSSSSKPEDRQNEENL
ncbi:SSBP1 (predicted) [Pycnogonum litorale]